MNIADENRPLNAPFWSVSENTTYTWDLPSGTLLARAGYDWRSFTNVAVYTAEPDRAAGLRPVQCRPRVHTTSKAWRFSIDGKNLTDRYYRVAGYDFGNPPIAAANSFIGGVSQIGFYGPPRTYAGTVTYHF